MQIPSSPPPSVIEDRDLFFFCNGAQHAGCSIIRQSILKVHGWRQCVDFLILYRQLTEFLLVIVLSCVSRYLGPGWITVRHQCQ
jgi:hypothetical protein